jgi:hypothetical protein
MTTQEKVRLAYVDGEIVDVEQRGLGWVENEIDSDNASCECVGPECDPETCPRFGDECSQCGAWVASGDGAYLLDGGQVYGDCCIEWVDASEVPS